MQVLYAARLARHDLLRPTLRLASQVTKWDSECDKKLHRLMRYINCTPKKRLIGWCADKLDECSPHGYADADFAGCDKTLRSTTGACMIMEGSFTRFPVAARSIKQGCISCSTPEAELVACHYAYKNLCLPMLDLLLIVSP